MAPSFHEGDVVLFLPFRRYYPGNVVIAMVKGREVIKRIAQVENNSVFLAGDNVSASTDSRTYGLVEYSAIKGRLCFCLPMGTFTARRR